MDTQLIKQITEMLNKLPNSICRINNSIDEGWIAVTGIKTNQG